MAALMALVKGGLCTCALQPLSLPLSLPVAPPRSPAAAGAPPPGPVATAAAPAAAPAAAAPAPPAASLKHCGQATLSVPAQCSTPSTIMRPRLSLGT